MQRKRDILKKLFSLKKLQPIHKNLKWGLILVLNISVDSENKLLKLIISVFLNPHTKRVRGC